VGGLRKVANLVSWWEDLNKELKKSPEFLAESLAFRLSLEIKERMKEAGLSQTALAVRLGVSKAYISQVLAGKTNMTILSLTKIAKALGSALVIDLYPVSGNGNRSKTSSRDPKNRPRRKLRTRAQVRARVISR
jgi:transcriptional regulator with XRE-family HTH domain